VSLDSKIYQYNPESNKVDLVIEGGKDYSCVEFQPEGLQLSNGSVNGELQVIDMVTQIAVHESSPHQERIGVIQWLNNSVFVTGSKDSLIVVHDLRQNMPSSCISEH
jgi:WD40 repeat protein